MNDIVIGKVPESTKAGACIVYRTPKNEEYQEYLSECPVQEGDEDEHYDPELDSPSSWTTKSSQADQPNCNCGPSSPAALARVCSNLILILMTVTGIIFGALEFTGTYLLPKYAEGDHQSIGGMIIFGAVVGGAVSLMLVNVSWWYRGKHFFNLQAPCCPGFKVTCPTAQVASSCIVLCVAAILVPTYHQDKVGILVIIFGIVLPLLVMVNLPLMIDPDEEELDKDEDEVEAVPGNLEGATNVTRKVLFLNSDK